MSLPNTVPAADTSRRGPAFWIMVLSTVNLLAVQVFGLLGIAANVFAYAAINGGFPERPESRGRPNVIDWVGRAPVELPWWALAVSGAVAVLVVVLALDPRRRYTVRADARTVVYRTDPLFLTLASVLSGCVLILVGTFYDGLYSVASPYWIGPALWFVAAIVAFAGRNRGAAAAPKKPSRSTPTTIARVTVAVSTITILVVIVAGFGGVVLGQAAYLAAHGGDLPREPAQGEFPYAVWQGALPFVPSVWVFVISNIVLLGVILVSIPKANRYEYDSARGRVWQRTTPRMLLIVAAVSTLVQFVAFPYLYQGGGGDLGLLGGQAFALLLTIGAFFVAATDKPQAAKRKKRSPAKANQRLS